jgi:hypothetical protein
MKSLSVSSLVEYMHASPSRRTAILRNAINPPVFIVDRYGITYRAAGQALCNSSIDPIIQAELGLASIKAKSIQRAQRIANTLESLDHAKRVLPFLFDDKTTFLNAKSSPKYLSVAGLSIKVLPQALAIDSSHRVCGITRFHCSKTFRANGEVALDFATILNWFTEQNFGNNGDIDPKHCKVVDVFAETFSSAPKSTIRRKKSVQDTCQEISDRWEALANRLGHSGFGKAA